MKTMVCVDVMMHGRYVGQFRIETNPLFPLKAEEIRYEAQKRFPQIREKKDVHFEFGERKPNR
jgi:hypothetical protein